MFPFCACSTGSPSNIVQKLLIMIITIPIGILIITPSFLPRGTLWCFLSFLWVSCHLFIIPIYVISNRSVHITDTHSHGLQMLFRTFLRPISLITVHHHTKHSLLLLAELKTFRLDVFLHVVEVTFYLSLFEG